MPNLSPHLTEAEFLTTQHRDLVAEQRRVWSGTPSLRDNARLFAMTIFENVRAEVGVPLHVTSGYRCPPLNSRVGGVSNSRHMLGMASDIVPIGLAIEEAMLRIAKAVKAGRVPRLDKAIIECGTWIHIQGAVAGQTPRNEVLATADGIHFKPYIV